MIILDSNTFIYLANGTLEGKIISNEDISHDSITKIECLGFARIHANGLQLHSSITTNYGRQTWKSLHTLMACICIIH